MSYVFENVEVIFHIGAPKTGSSLIQKVFCQNSNILRKSGFYYPKHGLDPNGISGGHWDIVSCLEKGDVLQAKTLITKYLEDARRFGCKLLLSAEGFFTNSDRLTSAIPDCEFKIVAFFRHPLESFYSSYNQDVKRHYLKFTISEYALLKLAERPAITGEALIDWERNVGKDQMLIIPYSEEDSFDVMEVFCKILKVPYFNTPRRINLSYTPCALELKRMLNLILDHNSSSMNSQLDYMLQAYSDTHFPIRPKLNQILGDKEYEVLNEKYSEKINKIENFFVINQKVLFYRERF